MTADSPKSDPPPKKNEKSGSKPQPARSVDVFDIDRIRQIVELMKQHELNEVDLQQADDRIRLTRGGAAPAAPIYAAPAATPPPFPAAPGPAIHSGSGSAPSPVAAAGTITINSPMVGTFYGKANPEAPPFVKVGDTVSEDTVVCIIEAMKVFNEIPAECSGKVVEVLVNDQEPVDFGKPLFRIQTSG
ncbi:acetyl-CoA carboxylase biotin carboxyl carrier protein [Neorhodopirellula pilleata]|uniref:Biotin carboxyl carrier protein of acetyl-CoA carboxylase n=1 Tax=Neorhodopirellula pilleata TaxID=2714738 RepID=A0A5C6AE85_9BACT|nr:acetyl-CoA carboxylase biotin carboxyl carrier protein [Neorhodopirellula pilleata]TWT97495.1 Acetyl-CoA biotin carboxyl carrier [Neorhodopirellula pilleata]